MKKSIPILKPDLTEQCGTVELNEEILDLMSRGTLVIAPGYTISGGVKSIHEFSIVPLLNEGIPLLRAGAVSETGEVFTAECLKDMAQQTPTLKYEHGVLLSAGPLSIGFAVPPHRMTAGRGDALGAFVRCSGCGMSRDNQNFHPPEAKHTFDCAIARGTCICSDGVPSFRNHEGTKADWLLIVLRHLLSDRWTAAGHGRVGMQSWLMDRLREIYRAPLHKATMPCPPEYTLREQRKCRIWPFRPFDHRAELVRQEDWLTQVAVAHTGLWVEGGMSWRETLKRILDDFEQHRYDCGCEQPLRWSR